MIWIISYKWISLKSRSNLVFHEIKRCWWDPRQIQKSVSKRSNFSVKISFITPTSFILQGWDSFPLFFICEQSLLELSSRSTHHLSIVQCGGTRKTSSGSRAVISRVSPSSDAHLKGESFRDTRLRPLTWRASRNRARLLLFHFSRKESNKSAKTR